MHYLSYSIVHIIGISIAIFALLYSGVLIRRYCRKWENVELFWIAWLLVVTLVLGNKFI